MSELLIAARLNVVQKSSPFVGGSQAISSTGGTLSLGPNYGTSITPKLRDSEILVWYRATASNSAANSAISTEVYSNTTGIPAVGAIATGSFVLGTPSIVNNTPVNSRVTQAGAGIVFNVAVGTPLFFFLVDFSTNLTTTTYSPDGTTNDGFSMILMEV